MAEEIHEMHEHAEEAHHDPGLAPVSMTMAILAVLVAVVSLLGHRAHTEELLLQNKATDTWAQYQAQSIRRHTYELFLDLVSISDLKSTEQVEKTKEKYSHEVERYRDQQKEIGAEARSLEDEVRHEQHKADRFDLGEVCLEAALVITSMTLMTRRRLFWGFGSVLAIAGLAIAVTGFFVH